MSRLSRREFVALAATGVAAAPRGFPGAVDAAADITAQDVVDRIKKSIGVEWKAETVDTFKAGAPGAVVRGIATTPMATLDVLKKAVSAGANLIVTFEPTFYGRADSPTPPAGRGAGPGAGGRGGPQAAGSAAASSQGQPAAAPAVRPDPIFAAKNDFIAKNNLVVWRFSDHWRLRQPDPLAEGLAGALGWSGYRSPGDPGHVTIPSAITLTALASQVKSRLGARGGVRVVGDPGWMVRTIALLPGSTPIQKALERLPAADVVLAGEVREWESVEYARDKVTAGDRKGLILVGRVLSEEPGMKVCAEWLRKIVPELATTWVPAGDPYWRPR
jgi:putative NIF3 family GTP cyclohydrolase 1 type 2